MASPRERAYHARAYEEWKALDSGNLDYNVVGYRFTTRRMRVLVSFPRRWALAGSFEEGRAIYRFAFKVDYEASPREFVARCGVAISEGLLGGVGRLTFLGYAW